MIHWYRGHDGVVWCITHLSQNSKETCRWFYPHFGFAYKAINTNVKVIFVSDIGGSDSKSVLMDQSFNELNTNWQYFFKNLSDVSFLNGVWSDLTEPELLWQIVL